MKIDLLYGKEGADRATGAVVVVDVFRAATTAAYAFGSGAECIIPVALHSEALALKQAHPEYVTTGEDGGIKIEGFDYGNSPSEMSRAVLQGKVLVQRTSAGTQGLVRSSVGAAPVFFGGFPTFSATVGALRTVSPDRVSVVAMDGEGSEDDIYAGCLRAALMGEEPDWPEVRERLRGHLSAQRFFQPEKLHSPREDFDLCVTVDAFPFAVRLIRSGGGIRLVKA